MHIELRVSPAILLVADLFHPFDDLAVERFLNGDVRHGGSRCGTVPVLHARWKPDDIAGADFFDRAAFALRPAAACRDNEPLAERMRVPGRPGTRLESDAWPHPHERKRLGRTRGRCGPCR